MDNVTKAVADYIKQKGIAVSVLSEQTHISYGVLQPCISGKRKLRASEFMAICKFLEENPFRFYLEENNDSKVS